MGEIDDLYQQEAEAIDLNFLEELKTSKDHEKSLARYLYNLRKAREKFEKLYGKFNDDESKRISKMKKKIEKLPEFKHLEIAHFDFEPTFLEKKIMWWDVWSFNFNRKIRRLSSWMFPKWLVYVWFKVKIFLRRAWNDFVDFKEDSWAGIKSFTSSIISKSWEFVKKVFAWILEILKKVLFWRKKGEAGEGDDKKEGEAAKEEEKKD